MSIGLTRQQLTIVAILICGAFLVVFTQTLLTPAYSTIMEDMGVAATTVQWLTSGYSLVESVVIPLNAFLLGRFGARRIFIGALILFECGTLLCAFSPNFALLLVGRMLQASATGAMMPSVFAVILLIFPKERRGTAMGLVGLIVGVAPAIGPALSGVMVDAFGWRSIFAIVFALAAIILIIGIVALKGIDEFPRIGFDAPSVALMAIGMVSLLYGISVSTSSPNIAIPIVCILVGLAFLFFFGRRQLALSNPILKVRTLESRRFLIDVIVAVILEAVLLGVAVVFPIFAQQALGYSATVAGLILLPGSLASAVVGMLTGRGFDHYGARWFVIGGATVMTLSALAFVFLGEGTSVLTLVIVNLVFICGLQAIFNPLNTWGINSLPNVEVPHGNAILSTMEQVGSSLGTALIVSLTALSTLFVSADAGPATSMLVGSHIAFFGVFVLGLVVVIIAFIFVKDDKDGKSSKDDEGVPEGAPAD